MISNMCMYNISDFLFLHLNVSCMFCLLVSTHVHERVIVITQVCLSVPQSVRLSVCLSVSLSAHPSVSLSGLSSNIRSQRYVAAF